MVKVAPFNQAERGRYLMEISLVEGINSFASITSDPRLTALLVEICQRIESLELENKNLKARILDLELNQDEHGEKINEHAEAINKVWSISKRSIAPKGQKTNERLRKLDQILKTNGARTLTQLEKDLGILPQEMSRLLSKIDKRKYQIFLREGNRREKVIKLRSRIN